MSQLQKKIGRIQRRESPRGIGFGSVVRDQPRGMLLAVIVNDKASATAAVNAGADAVIFKGANGQAVAKALGGLDTKAVTAGAWVDTLDDAGAKALREAGCDFAISTLETTASTAVDVEEMGQVIKVAEDIDDTTLRALGPLSLDALYIERPAAAMTLAGQLSLVRLASFSNTPLTVPVTADAQVSELRVLRDSGTVMVVAPAGTGAEAIKTLVENLKSLPAPKRSRRDGQEMALVPSIASAGQEHEDDDGDGDGDDE
ncbi:MAG: hypothetical protein ACM3S1_09890 [Hyphomicrobiales bacterium]